MDVKSLGASRWELIRTSMTLVIGHKVKLIEKNKSKRGGTYQGIIFISIVIFNEER